MASVAVAVLLDRRARFLAAAEGSQSAQSPTPDATQDRAPDRTRDPEPVPRPCGAVPRPQAAVAERVIARLRDLAP